MNESRTTHPSGNRTSYHAVSAKAPLSVARRPRAICRSDRHSTAQAAVPRPARLGLRPNAPPFPDRTRRFRRTFTAPIQHRTGRLGLGRPDGRGLRGPPAHIRPLKCTIRLFQDFAITTTGCPTAALPVDWESAVRFACANARIGLTIADDPEPPAWNAAEFFGEKFSKGERPP